MLMRKESRVPLGQCVFDIDAELLYNRFGKAIHLRNQSLEVLRLLVEKQGMLVRREYIFKVLWENRSVTDDSLTQCVKEIRRAIGDTEHTVLVTAHSRGYRLFTTYDETSGAVPYAADLREPGVVPQNSFR